MDNKKPLKTFTKKWTERLLVLFIIWISLTYILAFMGKESIAETLSQDVMTGGVAVFLGYLLKAYFETYSEEKLKFNKELMNISNDAETGEYEPTDQ